MQKDIYNVILYRPSVPDSTTVCYYAVALLFVVLLLLLLLFTDCMYPLRLEVPLVGWGTLVGGAQRETSSQRIPSNKT